MNKPDMKSYSILRAFKMPAVENSPSIPIAAGKLSKVIEYATKVSSEDYYGMSIDYGGGILNEQEIQAIAQQADISKQSKFPRDK